MSVMGYINQLKEEKKQLEQQVEALTEGMLKMKRALSVIPRDWAAPFMLSAEMSCTILQILREWEMRRL